ncbi:hypothetical protein IWX49DRAFT_82765 [Phyllosticta citricarpa]|uniref:Secreted protein n=1 Tax=Phyllosticta citricarpa TaxID=55181 RepID=A0ABR1MQ02_9PEZI
MLRMGLYGISDLSFWRFLFLFLLSFLSHSHFITHAVAAAGLLSRRRSIDRETRRLKLPTLCIQLPVCRRRRRRLRCQDCVSVLVSVRYRPCSLSTASRLAGADRSNHHIIPCHVTRIQPCWCVGPVSAVNIVRVLVAWVCK